MLRFILLTLFIVPQAFAHTECYFDQDFQDGSRGFILQSKQVTLILPYSKFKELELDGERLLLNDQVVGELKMIFPRGLMKMGKELSGFQCKVWSTGGRG